jgi:hypothetical protein
MVTELPHTIVTDSALVSCDPLEAMVGSIEQVGVTKAGGSLVTLLS